MSRIHFVLHCHVQLDAHDADQRFRAFAGDLLDQLYVGVAAAEIHDPNISGQVSARKLRVEFDFEHPSRDFAELLRAGESLAEKFISQAGGLLFGESGAHDGERTILVVDTVSVGRADQPIGRDLSPSTRE